MPPSPLQAFACLRLDASTGASDPNDFTVRDSALVFRAPASTAPCPTFATMANAPFRRDRMAGGLILICPTEQREYFSSGGLTSFPIFRSDLPVGLLCRSHHFKMALASKANHPTGSAEAHRAARHQGRERHWEGRRNSFVRFSSSNGLGSAAEPCRRCAKSGRRPDDQYRTISSCPKAPCPTSEADQLSSNHIALVFCP